MVQLADTLSGAGSGLSTGTVIYRSGRNAYFQAAGGDLWRTDGTPAGTAQIGARVFYPPVAAFGGVVFLQCTGCAVQGGLYYNSGTGPSVLFDPTITLGSPPVSPPPPPIVRIVNGRVLYTLFGSPNGGRLAAWDPVSGIIEILTPPPATSGPSFGEYCQAGSRVYMVSGPTQYKLWTTDGTVAGTHPVVTLPVYPFWGNSLPRLIPQGESVYYALGTTVWTSDGTEAGTRAVGQIPPIVTSSPSVWGSRGAEGLYYLYPTAGQTSPTQLFHLGPAGTSALVNFQPGVVPTQLGSAREFSVFANGGNAYANSQNPVLWVSDGTPLHTLAMPGVMAGSISNGLVIPTTDDPPVLGGSQGLASATVGDSVYFLGVRGGEIQPWRIDLLAAEVGPIDVPDLRVRNSVAFGLCALDGGRGLGVFGRSGGDAYGFWAMGPRGEHARFVRTNSTMLGMHAAVIGSRVIMPMYSAQSFGIEPHAIEFCSADYDNSGELTTGDLFQFLNDWLNASPHADYDHANGLDAADVVGYLNDWIAGCP